MKSINEVKELLKTLENEKERLQKALKETESKINALMIEVAESVLKEQEKEPQAPKIDKLEGKVAMVRIEFKPGGKTYDYLWNQKERPGEFVFIDSYDRGVQKVRVVKAFWKTRNPNVNYKEAYPEDPGSVPFQ